jgi:DHA3 family macrolide efflux protein-like MFS transporter
VTTFLVVWAGQLVSQIGTAMTAFALLIWMYERTGRATSVALLGFFWFAPVVALGPLAGVWVDRHDRRRVMLLADAAAAVMTAAVLALYLGGRLEVWHLYAAEAVAGACWAFQGPAYTAATTMLLPARHYARASGLRSVATFGAEAVAPFLAGVAVVALGLAGVLVIDLATFAVAVATLAAVRIPRPAAGDAGDGGDAGFAAELRAGFQYLRRHRGLLSLLAIYTGINFFAALTYYAILPPMILARTGRDALALASVQSALGVGAVAGGLLMGVWGGPRRKLHGVLAGAAVSFFVGDLLFALGHALPVWVVAALVGSFFVPVIIGCDLAIWQARVPPALQGRVFAIRSAVRMSTMPLGYLLGGVLADHAFEPALAPGGALAPWLGPLVGVGPGAGMAAMFLGTALAGTAMSLAGYLIPAVRAVDREDHPGRGAAV